MTEVRKTSRCEQRPPALRPESSLRSDRAPRAAQPASGVGCRRVSVTAELPAARRAQSPTQTAHRGAAVPPAQQAALPARPTPAGPPHRPNGRPTPQPGSRHPRPSGRHRGATQTTPPPCDPGGAPAHLSPRPGPGGRRGSAQPVRPERERHRDPSPPPRRPAPLVQLQPRPPRARARSPVDPLIRRRRHSPSARARRPVMRVPLVAGVGGRR